MRIYKNITDKNQETIRLMESLLEPGISVTDYRNSFYAIGKALGLVLNEKAKDQYGNTMISCASEDADWLVQGVMESLSQKEISLAVFWSDRIAVDAELGLDYSPIIRSYVEPIEDCKTLILVKSIISTSCVVRTQLTHLINKINPQVIYIVSPVMYKDSEESLRKEFPTNMSEKFRFIYFAIDDERDEHGVIPGIGGMVYPKIGLGDHTEKNKYIPALVKQRAECV